ncbi:baseplate J/gp47 family protein [Amycolatopsis sp. FBCC-B4732]|uniref:baseplate J/gp47 family protein n=1 Tax=Amycolatopsis sp. FBCC-B4732 TaxID=3079339 RepID=UPI001FF39691|nr:baseplate J/gp47 family protein [Amycolatopsis sp. FBCC-B4732]UOX91111.1 baseplate J/gp47 family protein [Amycolatopsis sp. FBCC-B4732]
MSDETSIDLTDVLAVDETVTRTTGSAGFGVTPAGFLPKPFTRLLAEKIALAQQLIDPAIDLSSGSVVRKLLEVTALEDARTWAALAAEYDDSFVGTARGRALSDLGEELGITRPFLAATGSVTLTLAKALPASVPKLVLPRGSRLSTPGGHRVALAAAVQFTTGVSTAVVPVTSFDPGPVGNLDPAVADAGGGHPQRIDRWEVADAKLAGMIAADVAAGFLATASSIGQGLVRVQHTQALTGGNAQFDDDRYRALLLAAPRSLWTADSIAATVALVAGVRQVVVRDGWGGLDLSQSIFGQFAFFERLFAADRDLSSPFFVTVLVAPTEAAVWDGASGLRAAVQQAIRDVRPVGIFPDVVRAEQVFFTVQSDVVTAGLPLPSGSVAGRNLSPAALALKQRLAARLRGVVDGLSLAEPVRAAALSAAMMAEPGVVDVGDLHLMRFPYAVDGVGSGGESDTSPDVLDQDENLVLGADQIAVFVESPGRLTVR